MSVQYHDRTKHHFQRFAPSLGYLDWATQPNPFRRYEGARLVTLPREPQAAGVPYEQLFQSPVTSRQSPAPLDAATVGEFLRCSLGLSAWKQYGSSRWALRVNPSSGNLHPTEGYVVTGVAGLESETRPTHGEPGIGVFHYAPREHALEERCRLPPKTSRGASLYGSPSEFDWSRGFLVGLTSIHWREAWKYGERAFRYCQHDAGHAIAAVRFAAALLGWQCAILPRWSDAQIAGLLGLTPRGTTSRGTNLYGSSGAAATAGADDHDDPEPEAPDCLLVVSAGDVQTAIDADPSALVEAFASAEWTGRANRLSPTHVQWPAIEDVERETTYRGADLYGPRREPQGFAPQGPPREPQDFAPQGAHINARQIILQRRSAVEFDGRGTLAKGAFARMLQYLVPESPPWDAIWWPPQVHLVLFVHRVDGVLPGIYAFVRADGAREPLQAACRSEFLWEPVDGIPHLFLLAPLDARAIAVRLSCDQNIAGDGFFGIAMLTRFEDALAEYGPWFYRNLFWECGMIGQVLYLDAEAAGARATGIGCFYDDPVHELLGLSGHAWQSLYHFSAGIPVEDTRLTSEPGYEWESWDREIVRS